MNTLVMNSQRARLIQSEKMSAAGNLLAGIVHELNNPLTTILGFSELLLRDGQAADPARLEKIHSEAERSVRIIQNVLRLARADNGSPEIIDVSETVKRTAELAQYQLRLNRIDVDMKLGSGSPKVFAHPGELTQVVLNLVTNAIQAISAVKASGQIRISTSTARGRVCIVVSDDGPGIRETDMKRLFEPFFTTKQTGTGLGLNLSRKLIRGMGGDLRVSSAPGCGATFTIELPVTNAAEMEQDSGSGDARLLAPGRSVLIVDDEDHITELIDSVLQYSGYRTERLNDGAPAIELLKQEEYDILICDLHMPGIGGRDLVEWCRVNRKNMRILLLSGDVARKDSREFAKSCGAHFLSKPFSVAELTQAVQRLSS